MSMKLCASVTIRIDNADHRAIRGGSEGVINFPWIFFYAMRSLVPVGHFLNISGHLFTLGLFAGLFSEAMGYCLPIVSCEMTKTK